MIQDLALLMTPWSLLVHSPLSCLQTPQEWLRSSSLWQRNELHLMPKKWVLACPRSTWILAQSIGYSTVKNLTVWKRAQQPFPGRPTVCPFDRVHGLGRPSTLQVDPGPRTKFSKNAILKVIYCGDFWVIKSSLETCFKSN